MTPPTTKNGASIKDTVDPSLLLAACTEISHWWLDNGWPSLKKAAQHLTLKLIQRWDSDAGQGLPDTVRAKSFVWKFNRFKVQKWRAVAVFCGGQTRVDTRNLQDYVLDVLTFCGRSEGRTLSSFSDRVNFPQRTSPFQCWSTECEPEHRDDFREWTAVVFLKGTQTYIWSCKRPTKARIYLGTVFSTVEQVSVALMS